MGITSANKQIDIDHIDCDGSVKVTLALAAAPDITTNPTDIVLILDRSGSMDGKPLENLKLGANIFIDIIDESTDSAKDGNIGSGSHIGIVSFDGTATADTQLITSVAELKDAVDDLTAGGLTNHAAAFAEAISLFDPASPNAKVIVMFTDGKTTVGDPPSPVAAAARAAGIVIFVIGLVGDDGIDEDALNDWATDPDSSHVVITPDEGDLEDIFADLAKNISKPGSTDIVIDEVINPDFVITSISLPTKGTAIMVNSNTLQWKIDELGVTANEGAAFEFIIRHIAQTSGVKHVNASISFDDAEGNSVTFPDPEVDVDCGQIVEPEPCPEPKDVIIHGCQDAEEVDIGDVFLESLGRILEVDLTIKDVCPNRRVALAVILTEIDHDRKEHKRGLKTITVPAHHTPGCRDVRVKCLKFILPEDLDVFGGSQRGICNDREFKVRAFAHYIDNDFDCCGEIRTQPDPVTTLVPRITCSCMR